LNLPPDAGPQTTRFAPSPTGRLHLGHAFAALYAARAAAGGRLCLRIEDLDVERAHEAFADGIIEDLAWLGVHWSPPPLRQSHRTDAYAAALTRLQQMEMTYPCFCTRREIALEASRAVEAPHPSAGNTLVYAGTCRRLSAVERARRLTAGMPHAIRLDSARAALHVGAVTFEEGDYGTRRTHTQIRVDPTLFGDIILARKGLSAAYHLAVVVDDAFQCVTLVTRGQDLLLATHVQVLLQNLLQLPTPRYSHHALILDHDNNRLSKRQQAASLRSLRERGVTPGQVYDQLGIQA
jgi:glutamyl-Q tRNA(Asp) synthetase